MQHARLDLVAAGAGAGVAAGFGAPMAGVLFAVETMLLAPSSRRARVPSPHATAASAKDDDDGGLQVRPPPQLWPERCLCPSNRRAPPDLAVLQTQPPGSCCTVVATGFVTDCSLWLCARSHARTRYVTVGVTLSAPPKC